MEGKELDEFFANLDKLEKEPETIKPDPLKGPLKEAHPFHLLEVGQYGEFEFIDLKDNKNAALQKHPELLLSTLPFHIQEPFDAKAELERQYMNPTKDFATLEEQLDRAARVWEPETELFDLFHLDISKPFKNIELTLDYVTGEPSGVQELDAENADNDPSSSTSLMREPGSMQDFVRGSSKNSPFMPGGLEDAEMSDAIKSKKGFNMKESTDLDAQTLYKQPPGFSFGFDYTADEEPNIVGEVPDEALNAPDNLSSNRLDLLPSFGELQDDHFYQVEKNKREQDLQSRKEQMEQIMKNLQEEKVEIDEPAQSTEEVFEQKEDAPAQPAPEKPKSISELLEDESRWLSNALENTNSKKNARGAEWAVMNRMENIDEAFEQIRPELALEYPFELDDFQKEAVFHLEKGESVFVAAHTSAGKTVVAEYAIALGLKHMTRVIYTSPIKALSNQKFRDFKDTFEDVGLITGDVSLKPEATCLIVTTEILRSMLYKGADLIRDVEWVIFDEVHYINDLERGVVWEEVIIMLPDHVGLIFLSATVPNTYEFADWVGRTKKKKIFVLKTDKRPVPLEHYLYANKELYKIVDNKTTYLTTGYQAAANSFTQKKEKAKLKNKPGAPSGGGNNRPGSKAGLQKSEWNKIINVLNKKNLLPVVGFAFSKRKCEELSYGLGSLDLNTKSEKSEIKRFIDNAMQRLKDNDRHLPQVTRMKELLDRGIGIHHGGLLPIIKEIVEILFSKGLVKVLFATETFAMGVNMPARTVVFNSIRKHDGRDFRDLLPGEYIQMSGRAGRRGIDTVGTVIILCTDQVPEPISLAKMLTGRATKLESQFRLTYSMILNLFKMEGEFGVEDMIKRSFSESQKQKLAQQFRDQLKRAETMLLDIEDLTCDSQPKCDIRNYYSLNRQEQSLMEQAQKFILTSTYAGQYLVAGRIVLVTSKDHKLTNKVGAVLKVATAGMAGTMSMSSNFSSSSNQEKKVTVFVLTGKASPILKEQYTVLELPLTDVSLICKAKIKVDVTQVLLRDNKDEIKATVKQIEDVQIESAPAQPAGLDPIKDMKIKDLEFVEIFNQIKTCQSAKEKSKCHTCPSLNKQINKMDKLARVEVQVDNMRHLLSEDSLILMPEFKQRVQVLKTLGYLNKDNIVQIKGRVAREMNTVDELLATEMIFENVLTLLEPAEIAALLSCLVFEEKSEVQIEIPERLEEAKSHMTNIAISIANAQIQCGIRTTPLDYIQEAMNTGLMEVVYNWARNMSFASICTLTDAPEGTIVRTIVRLDETCRDFRNAARIVGDTALASKMEAASQLIKRDIVFASSLYY